MKKLLVINLIIAVFLLSACSKPDQTQSEPSGITITSPKDDTVNGYRTESKVDSSAEETPVTILFYANTKSKKFHKSDCYIAKNIANENLYITEFRDELIDSEYSPCNKCKP